MIERRDKKETKRNKAYHGTQFFKEHSYQWSLLIDPTATSHLIDSTNFIAASHNTHCVQSARGYVSLKEPYRVLNIYQQHTPVSTMSTHF